MLSSHLLFQSNRICMTQHSDPGKQDIPLPADQFKPLQSVFRRRLLTGLAAASALAVGANFAGITSFLLGFTPQAARNLKLDALYPVGGYSRYIDTTEGFEFVYPEGWLGDQTLLYLAAGKAERPLDPPALGQRRRNEPSVAFGPAGSSGELNVSVVVSSVPADFSIEMFGGAKEVGEAIVGRITASGNVKGRLIGSDLREDVLRKVKYYELEFEVESPVFRRRNVAVCCAARGKLFTLNAQAPQSGWTDIRSQFYTIAHSFYLL